MLNLHGRIRRTWDSDPLIVRISTQIDRPESERSREALIVSSPAAPAVDGFRIYFNRADSLLSTTGWGTIPDVVPLPTGLEYLTDGDILRISPRSGEIWVMYRRESRFNSIFLTERCNSDCIMCSQPPKNRNDDHLLMAFLEAIPLMDPATAELGITGGEPTLLGENLLRLIRLCADTLPSTALHMLSNGRMFNYLSLCREVATINHPDFVIGIPLYSDVAHGHDFVVQARGAFDQTIRGIMNLERCKQRVEIRVVLHRHTIPRLPQLARYIARNLPFVEHVALMGLEMMGYVRMNLDALWVDPVQYQGELLEAVQVLRQHRMNVSIYNHQLCILDRELWPFARKSISDWKNEYHDVCRECAVQNECGGFFASADIRSSDGIRAVLESELLSEAGANSPYFVQAN